MNSNLVPDQQTTSLVVNAKPSAAGLGATSCAVLKVLKSGEPRSTVQVALASGLPVKTTYHALYRLWYMGRVLRSSKPRGRVQLPNCSYSDRPDYSCLIRRGEEQGRIVHGVQYVTDAGLVQPIQVKSSQRVMRNSLTGRIVTELRNRGFLSFRQLVEQLKVPEKRLSAALFDLYRTN